jgi:hypothetical protein
MDFHFFITLALLLQGTPGNPPADALTFLRSVTQQYADAKSYHIEATMMPARPQRSSSRSRFHGQITTMTTGLLAKAFGREAIPLGVLIDPEGKITFYRAAYDVAELRVAISKLGPAFTSVAAIPATNGNAPTKR